MTLDEGRLGTVRNLMLSLQARLCAGLEHFEPEARFGADDWRRPGGGGGSTRVLSGGEVFEQAGVNFSHVHGASLPEAASARRPELAGGAFQALGVSCVVHPRNPYVPTSHCNVRHFTSQSPGAAPVWWFGGGFDLTPCYGSEEDAVHWHRAASRMCSEFEPDLYRKLKRWCDEYFFLRHRGEARGIGGIFFDDLNRWPFERCLEFTRRVATTFLDAYTPIVERRRDTPYGRREREFQLLRRGRYVEFNLICDRGTLFGLQSGGRTESILMSLPPRAAWAYRCDPGPGTSEERLRRDFLVPRDWLEVEPAPARGNALPASARQAEPGSRQKVP